MTCFHIAYSLCHILGALSYILLSVFGSISVYQTAHHAPPKDALSISIGTATREM
jgi:hypothetical protein